MGKNGYELLEYTTIIIRVQFVLGSGLGLGFTLGLGLELWIRVKISWYSDDVI